MNLANYETVADRIKRFNQEHPDGRIETRNHTTAADRERGEWIIEARVYLNVGDQAADLPKAVGWAFERDGGSGANRMAALENAETSARGRALAAIYGNQASQEEMLKAKREQPAINWQERLDAVTTAEEARALYMEAQRKRAPFDVVQEIKRIGQSLKESN